MFPPRGPFQLSGEPGYLRAGVLFLAGSVLAAMGIDDLLHRPGPEAFGILVWGAALLIGAASDFSIAFRQRQREKHHAQRP